ncbi:MAG TPA: alpha-2-macroglobulin family protein, partial [Myxococcota bacterium]|nr:alpha-2-macroglobulin family protein [Myxococcota bacterium]
ASTSPSQVRFVFDHPVARTDGAQPASVRVTPEVAVELTWLRSDTLVVRPTTRWPDATRVKVELEGLDSGTQTLSAKAATEFVAYPLEVASSAGSLLYPSWLTAGEQVTLWFNQPVPLPSSELIRLEVAKSREDLSANRTSPVKATLSATSDPKVFRITIPGGPAVGHWYRLTVSSGLRGTGPEPLGADFTSILRGPDPFGVTGFSCGWPRCTTEDKWTFSFNGEPDEKSFAACFSVTPNLQTRLSKEGWSLVVEPISAKLGETYRLTLSERCRDRLGQSLEAPYVASAVIERPTPRLSMVTGTGFLAPAEGRQAIAIEAHHANGVEVGLKRLAPEELSAFLANHLEEWGGLDLDAIEIPKSGVLAGEGKLALDLAPALVDGRGLVLARATTVHPDHPDDVTQRSALVQVTDLGLVAKSGPQDTLVWVTSLTDRTPKEGVTVELLTRAGEVLWSAKTDARGIATGPGVNVDEDDTKAGRVVVARLGADAAVLDLRHWQSRSDPYDFNLPYEWNPKSDLLRGQVFTERGVYRTSEKVYIKGFARFDRGRALEAVPVKALNVAIHDSRGNSVFRGEAPLGPFGDFDLAFDLSNEAPLGTWRITASAPGGEGSGQAAAGTPAIHGSLVGTFRVEAYRASTFEVKVRDLALSGDTLSARVEGHYYSGPAMSESDVTWWVTASRARFTPKGYEGFSFDGGDADLRRWTPTETSVPVSASGKGKLDADGALVLEAELGESLRQALSSGPKILQVEAEVTDVDQQTITGRQTLRVESADAYVGLKLSDRFSSSGAKVSAEVVALTPAGEPIEPRRATLRWTKRTWDHSFESVAGGGRVWVSRFKDEVLHEAPVTGLARGRVSVPLGVEGSGTFIAEVLGEDATGRKVSARAELYAWGDGASWSDNEGKLTVLEEKASWHIGETARYIVQSPFPNAKALVTVERSGVIERRVMDLVGSAPVIEVPVTADMAPNAYVSFALLGTPRNTGSDESGSDQHAELRLGYARLQVDTAERRVQVSVTPTAERHRPGERATVKLGLRDAGGSPIAGQVTLMVVDEGVLSLTAYKTPDPHAALHVERPLSVTTVDARKSLWQRLSADEGMKSDWGGGGEGGEPQNYRSAFATTAAFLPNVLVPESGETEVSFPLAVFAPTSQTDASGTAQISFTLPDNLTRFRVMAVAATRDGRFGSDESRIEVNKPLMIRPALPRFASVGDVFDARSVLTRLQGAGAVDVEVSVSGPVALEEEANKKIEIGASSKPVAFRVRALAPGEARFRVSATAADGTRDAYELPIPIQWPATMSKAVSTGWLAGNAQREVFRLEIPAQVRGDAGGLSIAIAPSRLNELLPSLDYLLQYPYGCVEQTT